jgi:NAD(P)H-nitrite reductase large subunit
MQEIEREFQEFVYASADCESLMRELKCGTGTECGSCLPEVERICEAARPVRFKAGAVS